jgi:hypothetical protein
MHTMIAEVQFSEKDNLYFCVVGIISNKVDLEKQCKKLRIFEKNHPSTLQVLNLNSCKR